MIRQRFRATPVAIIALLLWLVVALGGWTLLAAILAERFGPAFGGLFLAFPAIFPSSARLMDKHERQKKAQAGITATLRGRQPPRSMHSELRWAASDSLDLW